MRRATIDDAQRTLFDSTITLLKAEIAKNGLNSIIREDVIRAARVVGWVSEYVLDAKKEICNVQE